MSYLRGLTAGVLAAAAVMGATKAAEANSAICYNCPPQWADWASQLRAIQQHLGITVPHDNKNSGQVVSQLMAERGNPVADVAYMGISFGITAAEEGVLASYMPDHWDEIPEGLRDPDGRWFSIHSGTIGLFVNVDALGDVPVPTSWGDLLRPEYNGMVGYLDPSSAFVGYAGAVAVNQAMGGTMDDFTPAIEYFQALHANNPIVPKQTSYARVLSGEIPILFDYDFNAYRAIYTDGANAAFVIPEEGSIVVPYVMGLVEGAPNRENAERILDFIMSDIGQAVWANAYLRPIRSSAMPPEAEARFLPASEYERATAIDYGRMAEVQDEFGVLYLESVR